MPYKQILVVIDPAASTCRYEIAVDLAQRGGGQLTGLYLKRSLIGSLAKVEASDALSPADMAQQIRERLQAQDADAAKAAAALSKIASAAGVNSVCRVIDGDGPHDMIAEARHADLVVVGPSNEDGQPGPADIVLAAAVPVLIVPHTPGRARIGARVLIAWNGSRESSRALRDALPILTQDAVVEIRSAGRKHDRSDAAALCRYLEQHGCRPNLVVVEDAGQSIPKWLVGEAARADCDLIVMGVYGHMRQRDFVLSDVSAQMLQASPLPLLISH